MHFTKSASEYNATKDEVIASWLGYQGDVLNATLVAWVEGFVKQWVEGRFCHWQMYCTPTEFSTTNNSLENFNRLIKRFTGQKTLPLVDLFSALENVCRSCAISGAQRDFNCAPPYSI